MDIVALAGGVLEGYDLGVVALGVAMGTLAQDLLFTNQSTTDLRVGAGEGGSGAGQIERAAHKAGVVVRPGHRVLRHAPEG